MKISIYYPVFMLLVFSMLGCNRNEPVLQKKGTITPIQERIVLIDSILRSGKVSIFFINTDVKNFNMILQWKINNTTLYDTTYGIGATDQIMQWQLDSNQKVKMIALNGDSTLIFAPRYWDGYHVFTGCLSKDVVTLEHSPMSVNDYKLAPFADIGFIYLPPEYIIGQSHYRESNETTKLYRINSCDIVQIKSRDFYSPNTPIDTLRMWINNKL